RRQCACGWFAACQRRSPAYGRRSGSAAWTCRRWGGRRTRRSRLSPSEVARAGAHRLAWKRGLAFAQQRLQIQPPREHCELTVGGARPLRLRPVPVQLDAVLVGIAKVERLADAMVRGAVERNAGLQHSSKRVGELRSRRIENRRVIETGGARRRRRAAKTLPRVQPDVVVIAAGGQKRRTRTISLRQLEPEHIAI